MAQSDKLTIANVPHFMQKAASRLSKDQIDQLDRITFRDYLRVLFRHKSVIAVTIITVFVTVFISLNLKTKVYESQVRMLITAEKQVEATYYREMGSGANVQKTLTQSEIVKSDYVLGRVVRSLALHKRPLDYEKKFSSPLKARLIDYKLKTFNKKSETISDEQKEAILVQRAMASLKKSVNVELIRDTDMFTISARDYDPIVAAVIANVVSRSYVIFDLEQQLSELKLKYGGKHPTVNFIKESIVELKKKLSGGPIDDLEAIGPASVKIIQQANVPIDPAGISKKLTLALAFVMSIFLAVMLAFIFEYTDHTFKSPRDIVRTLGYPFIGSISRKKIFNQSLIKFDQRLSDYGRSYKAISEQLYLLLIDNGLKSLLFTSTLQEENNSIVVANLGNYFSKILRRKVLIIDANLSSPSMDRLFHIETEPGLANYLDGEAPIEIITNKLDENLYLIAAGKTGVNPIISLRSPRMERLMTDAAEEFDIVIVNAPHMRDQKSAAILSRLVDGTVLVVDEGKARRQVIMNVTMNGKLQNTIIGVILNKRTSPIPNFIYNNV